MKKFEKLTTQKFQTLENEQMCTIQGGLPSLPPGYTYVLRRKGKEYGWVTKKDGTPD